MSKRTAIFIQAAIVVAGLFGLALAPNAIAASHVTGTLAATSHAPAAHGSATLALATASKARFRVAARGLAPRGSFDVVVGGVKVGSFTSNAGGKGKLKLSTHPKRSQGLLGVDPRGKTIEVRDDQGDDDLEGDMDDDGESSTGAFACCVPDDDGSECEVETPDECSHDGGTTVSGVASCIPNPCGVTPPSEVVCCFAGSSTGAFVDEDSEAECDETSMQECATAGGTVVQATSCEPNPCAPTPPPSVTVCCVADGWESECEILTPEHCAAKGTPSTATSCDSDPCGNHSGGGDDGDSGSGGGDHSGGDHSGGDGGD